MASVRVEVELVAGAGDRPASTVKAKVAPAVARSGAVHRVVSARTWWIVAILAFAIRLGAAVFTGGLFAPEVFEYDALADAMLAGRGFVYHHLGMEYHSFAAPLYAWLTAACKWATGGSTVLLVIVQCLAGALRVVVAGKIAERLFAQRFAALSCAALVSLHPGLILYSAAKAHPLTIDGLFFTSVIWQFLRLADTTTRRRAIELGLLMGVGALTRATILAFLPIGAAWLICTAASSARLAMARQMLLAGVVALAVISPWTMRNHLLHRQFVFILSTDGEVLWRGNNPQATGHSYVDARHTVLDTLPLTDRLELKGQRDEVAQSRWFRERAWAYVVAEPLAAARATALKLYYFWWFSPLTGLLYPARWLLFYKVFYVAVLLCAGWGAIALVRARADGAQLLMLVGGLLLALSLLQSLYYVEGRHRWAIEPILMALAGGGLSAMWRRPLSASAAVGRLTT